MRNRAERRRFNVTKAIRKKNLSKNVNHFEYYDNLHQYSKNDIYCSCKYCRSNRKNDGPSIHERKELERMEFGENDDR